MRTADPLSVLAAAALALAAAPTAAGAGDAPPDIRGVALEELLDDPIGAASLEPERRSEAPAATFVLTAEDLRAFGFRTLGEALGSVPGLFSYRDDFFAMTGVRGLGPLMDYGTRLLVLVDGHPLTDSLGLGGAFMGTDLPVPLRAVKRIEVVKGPVGSLYGPSAFLGVVNVVTLDPDDLASGVYAGVAAAGGGGRGGRTGAVVTESSGRLGVTGAVELSGTRDDALRLPELRLPSDDRAGAADAGVRGLSGAGAAYLRLTWGGASLAGACGDAGARTVTAAYGANVGDPRNRMGTRHCYGALGWRTALGDRVDLALAAAYDVHAFWDGFAYAPPPDDVGVARDLGRDRWLSGDARLTVRPRDGTHFTVGLTTQQHRTLQRVYASGVPSTVEDPRDGYGPGDIEKDFLTLTAYAHVEQRLAEGLDLDAGATLHHHGLYGGRLTPKAALVWLPSDGNAVKLIWSQAFRAPTVSEAFYDDGDAYLANPGLEPEIVTAGELVLERRLGHHATLSASAHASRYDRLIRFVTVRAPGSPNPNDTRQQGVNEGSVDVVGAELSGTLRLGRWLRGHGGVAWQRTPRELVNFPSLTANLALATRALWEPLSLSAALQGASSRAKDPDNRATGGARVGGSLRLDLFAALEVPRVEGLTASLGLTNALGWAGPDPLLADNAPVTELPGAPRTLHLGLGYTFR